MYLRAREGLGKGPTVSTVLPSRRSLFERIQDALRQGLESLAISLAIIGGINNERNLTDVIFFFPRPGRRGQRLTRSEREQWRKIRDRVRRALEVWRSQLAQKILSNPRMILATRHPSGVSDNATARQNIEDTSNGRAVSRSNYGNARGGTAKLDIRLLTGILKLAETYSFSISELAGGSHSKTSRHYNGVTVDVNVINGQRVSAAHPDVPKFKRDCRSLGATQVLGPGDPGHATHIHCAWPRP
jgi:hypothetical protein